MNLTDRSDNLGGNDIKRLCLFYVTNVNYSHIFSVLQAICTHLIAALVYILLVNTIKVGTLKGRRFSTPRHTHRHTHTYITHRHTHRHTHIHHTQTHTSHTQTTHTHTQHTHTEGSVPHLYLRIVLNYHDICLNT